VTSPEFDISLDKDWINPVQLLELQKAVKHGAEMVFLNDRPFTIQYHGAQIFVQSTIDYAPCGWFPRQALLDYEFESEHEVL
jgi:hypothetical protein